MKKNLEPIQAIRKKCYECSNGQYAEIRDCIIETCPLFPFRTGNRHFKQDDNNTEQISLEFMIKEI